MFAAFSPFVVCRFSAIFTSKTILVRVKNGFVQWEKEKEESISVVAGKDVLGKGKEGESVTVITIGVKGKAEIYKASVIFEFVVSISYFNAV